MKSLLQTNEWTKLRQSQGWQAHETDGIKILQRELFLGKSLLYAPEVNHEVLSGNVENFLQNIKGIAKKTNPIFFRLEILDETNTKIVENLKQFGLIKAFEEIQPECRQIVDISISEEEIMAQMKEKGRYNIRVAQKHNVVIEKANNSQNIDDFYQIFSETAKRDGFQIRSKQYFQKLLEILEPKGFAELLVARYNNKPVAAEIVTYFDDTATYLYGASSNEFRNVMAPYLMHWEAIKRAKEKGCRYYDLLAVAPASLDESRREGEEKHKYAGISRFKRQFGGRTVNIVGSYDLVFQPFWYRLFKFGEKIRRR